MTGPVVVLVGPPGAGKSTVGRLVADRLGLPFRDTDTDIEAAQGVPISEIFVDHGEEHFRALERGAVAAAVAEHSGVLALGGGAVLAQETRALLEGGPVAFLDTGVGAAAKRVGLARDRPVLALNPRAALHQLLEQRRPLYEQVARLVVITDERTPDEVADQVLTGLGLV